MSRIFLVLFFCSASLPVLSQDKVLLKGKISNDSLGGSYINIVNISQKAGTVNSPSGEFEILVRLKDTLVFSAVQFKKLEVVITPEIFRKAFLEVELVENVNELDEVKLSNIKLSGNLSADLDRLDTYDPRAYPIPLSDKPQLSIVERKIHAMSDPMDPVGQLAGWISGDKKRLKLAKKNQDLQIFIYKAEDQLAENVFTEELSLPKAEIINFLYYCAKDPEMKPLVHRKDKLALIEFYQGKVADFKEFRSLD